MRLFVRLAAAVLGLAVCPAPALGWDLSPRFSMDGYLRTRGDLFYNFDLGRGPTPSTLEPIWPTAAATDVPYQSSMDMRVRVEPTLHVGHTGAVHLRLDILDNLVLGSLPVGGGPFGGLSASQGWPSDSVRVTRAWGEILLPFGALAVGRMGPLVDWGTGIWVDAGDGIDDDFGDVGDRVMLTTSLGGHLWMLAYEMTSAGAVQGPVLYGEPSFDLEPDDNARSWAFAFARYDTPSSIGRRREAGRLTINYGLTLALRFQDYELAPPAEEGDRPGPEDAILRDLRVVVSDLWFRLNWGHFRLELEGVYAHAEMLPTATAGVELTQELLSDQWGVVLQAAWEPATGFGADLELGVASGDEAPGFGVRFRDDQVRTAAGDLDGPQLDYARDMRVDNLRFHPNHRIDLILWRRIVGAITDAIYVRARGRYVWRSLTVETWLVFSSAMFEASTPGEGPLLGVEWDTQVSWEIEPGILIRGAYGVLFPLDGLTNPALGLGAEPAHTGRVVLAWQF